MQTVKKANQTAARTQGVNATAEPLKFSRRVGSTTFHVNVYFNPAAKETAQDKIARLIRNDATFGKAVNR